MTSKTQMEQSKYRTSAEKQTQRLISEMTFTSTLRNFDTSQSEVEKAIHKWWSGERWVHTKRHYTPRDVASLRTSIDLITPSHFLSKKLYHLLRQCFEQGTCSKTYGALDVVQAINTCKYLTSIYVSGWQCSSTHVPTHEPGPDFADYPMNTVPDKVMQLVKAQLFHDRKQNEERSAMSEEQKQTTKKVEYLTPIIADADAGFGGITSVMKLVKMFVEAGAGGIHIEDQKPGVKKCGHLGGKVLVSTREQVTRLQAARLQSDVMGCDLVLVARTDALSATFLDNNVDPVDHPFILGCVDPKDQSKLQTFPEAGKQAILQKFRGEDQARILKLWQNTCYSVSLQEALKLANSLGFSFHFDWESCRTDEGYYRVEGSVLYCIKRSVVYADYCDMIWMETPTPDLQVAQEYAQGLHAVKPHVMLAYNLSPSFNWDAQKMNEEDLENFIPNLASMGYSWQFITLAGFHMDALISEVFTKNFEKTGMLGFVQHIQRKEKEENVDQLLHQKWSGANLKDREVELASENKSSIKSNQKGGGTTEDQFYKAKL